MPYFFVLLYLLLLFSDDVQAIKCICEHSSCNSGYCHGDLCTYAKFKNNQHDTVLKNCMNTSKPLNRGFYGLEMIPESESDSQIGTMEFLLCTINECNKERPKIAVKGIICNHDTYRLEKMVSTEKFNCDGTDCVLGLMHETEESESSGDSKVCYKIELDQITDSRHSFKICHREKPLQFSVAICRRNIVDEEVERKTGTKNSSGRNQKTGKIIGKDEKGEARKGSKTEREEGNKHAEKTTKLETISHKNATLKSGKKVEEKNKESVGKAKNAVKNQKKGNQEKNEEKLKTAVEGPPPESPLPDESNATMVTIFVLLIAAILVVGIVWKFNLHRRLFRGNYDSVAGG